MLKLPLLLVVLCLGLVVAGCQDRAGTGWELSTVNLELTILPGEPVVQGRGTAVLHLAEGQSYGHTLRLHEGRQRFLSLSHPAQPTITIHQNGARASVRFAESFQKGDSLKLEFEYTIEQSFPADYPVHLLLDSAAVFATYGYNWHPQPVATKGGGDKVARGTLRLIMPRGWKSDSQGALVSSRQTEEHTIEEWYSSEPVARRFAAGSYQMVAVEDSTPARFLLNELTEQQAANYCTQLQRLLNHLEEWFGPNPLPRRKSLGYDPSRGISIIEVPDQVGFSKVNLPVKKSTEINSYARFDRFQESNSLSGGFASPVGSSEGLDNLYYTYDSRMLSGEIKDGMYYFNFSFSDKVDEFDVTYGDVMPWFGNAKADDLAGEQVMFGKKLHLLTADNFQGVKAQVRYNGEWRKCVVDGKEVVIDLQNKINNLPWSKAEADALVDYINKSPDNLALFKNNPELQDELIESWRQLKKSGNEVPNCR